MNLRRTTVRTSTLLSVAAVTALTYATVTAATGNALVVDTRAGNAAFPIGSAGIVVTFSVPVTSANYAVAVQPTNTAGYSPTTACTYFNVLNKTTTGFHVQHKTCDGGVPVALDTGISLNWIVTSYQ